MALIKALRNITVHAGAEQTAHNLIVGPFFHCDIVHIVGIAAIIKLYLNEPLVVAPLCVWTEFDWVVVIIIKGDVLWRLIIDRKIQVVAWFDRIDGEPKVQQWRRCC